MKDEERKLEVRHESGDERLCAERREFLKKCGRFAAYTAPAMVLMLSHKGRASANSVVPQ